MARGHRDPLDESPAAGRLTARLTGGVLVLLGLVLAVGGVWLTALGGSWYYMLAGIGLIAAGALMVLRNAAGAWVYLAVYGLTLIWAVWEAGLDGWALMPRVLAPTILLVIVMGQLSALRGRRDRSGWIGAGAAAAWSVLLAVAVAIANRPAPAGEAPAALAGMSDDSLMTAGADWPAYGGSSAARRHSPLTQITRGNVGRLERAWVYRTGDIPRERYSGQNTPIKVGDTLYVCSARNIVIALDAATGAERWRFDPQVSDESIPHAAVCRGVAYYDTRTAPPAQDAALDPDGGEPAAPAAPAQQAAQDGALCVTRIIEGTLDGRIIALDAATGRPCPGFGRDGQASITEGMGDIRPGYVAITSAPAIVRGVIVTGHQVLDGQLNDAPSGVIQGFDAVTGARRWAWDLGNPAITGLPPEGATWTPGTPNMWTAASAEETLGLAYLPLGNSSSDYWSRDRSALENEYASSLVALDVTTGRPVWHFRTIHIDVWDYDLGSTASLIDFPGPGGMIPAIVLPSKQGDLFVLDRRTGQPLTGVEERPVPQGGVEPEMRTPTQPFSTYHTLRRDDLTERDTWGMSPIDQMICRIQFRQAVYDGYFTPPTADRPWIQYPGYNGGSDWGGVAVDPQRGLIVANYNDIPNYNRLVPRAEVEALGWLPRGDPGQSRGGEPAIEEQFDVQAGVPYGIQVNPGWRMRTGLMCKEPPYGGIRAIEIATGRTVWDRAFGTARRNGPFGIPSMLPLTIGTPNNGGSVITAGGLIFIAAATDNLIRAIDVDTGETIWSDVLPAGGQANPMVYEQDGRQYLVVTAGGHPFMETPPGDYVIAYALPEGGE